MMGNHTLHPGSACKRKQEIEADLFCCAMSCLGESRFQLGFRVWRFRVECLGSRVQGLLFMV